MRGRCCVVTGASSGIGLETARGLARFGADVVLIGRTPSRVDDAVAAVRGLNAGGAASGHVVDFASLEATRALAFELGSAHPAIDVLVNNAGIWSVRRKESVDGHELTFAVNHLAPFLFTLSLLVSLRRGRRPRVVNVSSRLHEKARRFDFDDLRAERRRYDGLRAYQQSKLANVLFTRELARRGAGELAAFAVHPGDVATDVVRDSRLLSWGIRTVGKLWLLTPEEGARTSLYAATAPELDTSSGRYFAFCRELAPSAAAQDDAQAERLWALSERLTGVCWPRVTDR